MWEAKLAWADGVKLAELGKQDSQGLQDKGSRIILICFSSLVFLPCPHVEAIGLGRGTRGQARQQTMLSSDSVAPAKSRSMANMQEIWSSRLWRRRQGSC